MNQFNFQISLELATKRRIRRNTRFGFSLIEVVMAVGIVTFSLFALVGAIPVGIKTIQDSMKASAKANITQEIRAELQQVTFGTSAGNIDSLMSQVNYYSDRGILLPGADGAYYEASFSKADVPMPGSTGYFQSGNGQLIKVTLTYPVPAPTANQETSALYLLAAKQKSY
jgi:uncharacterized protein (TIGR02598 family)